MCAILSNTHRRSMCLIELTYSNRNLSVINTRNSSTA